MTVGAEAIGASRPCAPVAAHHHVERRSHRLKVTAGNLMSFSRWAVHREPSASNGRAKQSLLVLMALRPSVRL